MWDPDKDRIQRSGHGSMLDLAPARENDPGDEGDGARARPGAVRRPGPRLSTRIAVPPEGRNDPTPAPTDPVANQAETGLAARLSALLGRSPEENAAPLPTRSAAGPEAEIAVPSVTPARPFAAESLSAPVQAPFDPDRPLLDPSILLASVWQRRRLILATTIAGAVVGVLLALSTPHRYYAENRLFIDPREIRLTDNDLGSQMLSTEAMIALTDSQVQILSSTNVLAKVVEKLRLSRDPEFNGSLPAGGIAGGIQLLRDLVSGRDSASEAEQQALVTLRESVSVSRDPRTFVISVGVSSRDADKSALIANTLVDTYLTEEGNAQSGLMERTSEAIDGRIEALQADLNAAERAVEEYRARNDLVGVGGELIDDRQILALTEQLANVRAQKVATQVKADSLAKARIEEVLGGAFPEEFLSASLVELRRQYSQAKAAADSLGTRLGPRHPQYIAARSTVDSLRNEIRSELRRIVAASQAELQRAVETEQEMASQLAVAKTKSLDTSVELVTLRELERKAAATRQVYEGFLKRSRETSERGNLTTRNARVISPAEPPLTPDGPSRKILAAAGMVAGAVAGVAVALAFGAAESIRAYGAWPGGPVSGGTPVQPGEGSGPGRPRRRAAPDGQEPAVLSRAAVIAGGSRGSVAALETDEVLPGPRGGQRGEGRRNGGPAADTAEIERIRQDLRRLRSRLAQFPVRRRA